MADPPSYQVAENWDRVVDDYDEFMRPFSRRVAQLVLDAADPLPGEDFLDLATGTGVMAEMAIRRPDLVVAVDFAPRMIDALRAKIEDLHGPERVDGLVACHVMDAHELSFPAGSFASVGVNLSLPYFRDPIAALRQARRVLWSRGRIVISVIAEAGLTTLIAPIFDAIWSAEPSYVPPTATGGAVLSSAEGLRHALETAGFSAIEIDAHLIEFPIADANRYWKRWALDAPPVADLFRSVDTGARNAAMPSFVNAIEARRTGPELSIPVEVLVAQARRTTTAYRTKLTGQRPHDRPQDYSD